MSVRELPAHDAVALPTMASQEHERDGSTARAVDDGEPPLPQAGRNASQRRQAGFSLALTIVAIAVVAAGAAMTMFTRDNVDLAVQSRTAEALGAARDALIAYATARGGPTGTARPGELPCPDLNRDGRAEDDCAAGTVGRLPWLTLGIPEPRDGAGETLWYAVALPFRNRASNAAPINSDTVGTLQVFQVGGSAALANDAAAVVLAPGPALAGQNRSAQPLAASSYLEALQPGDNRAPSGPFINAAGAPTSTFNDRVLFIRAADFMPAVEQRVGAELRAVLLSYRGNSTCNCYPWAADWTVATGDSVSGRNRGRFPSGVPLPEPWGTGGSTPPPQWVAANAWHNVVFYSAGRGQLQAAGSMCTTCSSGIALTVTDADGPDAVSAVLMTPGTPQPGVGARGTLTSYFDDAQNSHSGLTCPLSGTVPAACDAYVQPTARTIDRDRLIAMTTPPQVAPPATPPPVSPPTTCSQSAATLATIGRTTTCGGPGNSVIASCQLIVKQMSGCSSTCKSAASAMVKPPCYNVSNKPNTPPQCASALTQLDNCK